VSPAGKDDGSERHDAAAGSQEVARVARFLGVAAASQPASGGSLSALAADWAGCSATVGERMRIEGSATLWAGERICNKL
tara:strand:+ start:317 stop:556 length:240 start_codon:yes stop_codon:yes gene_type:complete